MLRLSVRFPPGSKGVLPAFLSWGFEFFYDFVEVGNICFVLLNAEILVFFFGQGKGDFARYFSLVMQDFQLMEF